MAYSFEQVFAADPANPSNIAQNASITIFAPGDGTMTPIAITDPDGQPLANPIPVNANGFGSAFMADIDRVAWLGGGFTGFFTSYEGMKQVALDAQVAAEAVVTRADTGDFNGSQGVPGPPGLNGANVLPTDEAIAQAISTTGSNTRAAFDGVVVPLVASTVAADATVRNAAAVAVNDAVAGIDFGVVNPNDVGYDLWLIAGQSNAQGAAIDGDKVNIDITDPRVFQYGATAATPRANAGRISLASDPLIHRWTQATQTYGAGLTFGRWYAASIPTNRRVLLVPAAYSGTGFGRISHPPEIDLTWRTDPLPGSLSLYESSIDQTQAALAAAGPNSRIAGIIWVQGESDETQTPENYEMWLDALIEGYRDRFGIPDLPFLIGSMVPEGLVGNAGRTAIDAVHRDTPNRLPYTAFAEGPTGQFIDSGLHYNAEGLRRLADTLFFTALPAARTNEPPSLPTPAQVTGLTYGLPGSTYMPLSWSTAADASSYLVEYKETSSGTWLAGPTLSGTAVTVPGLTAATSYDFRVSGVNVTATGPASATLTVSTFAAGSLLSDLATSADHAYGLRKLHNGYTGSAIRVRRSSDNTEQDIGFVGADLDTAAITTFAGAGQAFIKTWYDQSGNARHLTQATTTAQARIANAGVVDVANGKPIAILNTNAYYSGLYAGMYAAGAATVAVVHKGVGTANGRIIAEASSAAINQQYVPLMQNATTATNASQRIVNDAGTSIAADTGTTAVFTASLAQTTVTDTGSQFQKRSNGVTAGDVSYTRSGVLTLDKFAIGALDRTTAPVAFAGVSLAEIIVWRTALSTADRNTVEANEKTYFGTP